MPKIHPGFAKCPSSFLFRKIKEKLAACTRTDVLDLTTGDAQLPVPKPVVDALIAASHEMCGPHMRGYGPEEGYAFLREAICDMLYSRTISSDEIFISDGTKSDTSALHELFDPAARILITDPIYPVYQGANHLAGRDVIRHLVTAESGFIPQVPDFAVDVIYLCNPNNPTGIAMNHAQLKAWVDYALDCDAIIIYDTVYSWFIQDEAFPRSIYEIASAEKVAIECNSFSKSHSFTGLRCAYTVVPRATGLHGLWMQRTLYHNNGVSYPIQRAAEAALSGSGMQAMQHIVRTYRHQALTIRNHLLSLGLVVFGGEHCPFLFMQIPDWFDGSSWDFFDYLLTHFGIALLPGEGLGKSGERYMRISCFTTSETTSKLITRLQHHGLRTPSLL